MSRSIETRIARLENAAGTGSDIRRLSDDQLDAAIVAAEKRLRSLTAKSDDRRLDEELLAAQSVVGGEVDLTYEAVFMPRTFAMLKAVCIRLGRPHHPALHARHAPVVPAASPGRGPLAHGLMTEDRADGERR